MQSCRGSATGAETAEHLGISKATWHRLERGTQPSIAVARILAKWLGWTTDQVYDAAEQPAPEPLVTPEPEVG